MIQDKNISRAYQRDFIAINRFFGQQAVDPETGKQLAAAATVDIGFPIPSHWDFGEDIGIRCIWESDGTGDVVTWLPTFKTAAFSDAKPTIDDALDTAIAADTDDASVANSKMATTWGVINAEAIDPTATGIDMFFLQVEMDATDGANPFLLGVEFCYLPKLTTGDVMAKGDFPADA